MNALYNYPTSGSMALNSLSGTAVDELNLYNFLSGKTYKSLLTAFNENAAAFKKLDQLKVSIDKMSPSAAKQKALDAYKAAMQSTVKSYTILTEGMNRYNEAVTTTSTYSFGFVTPPTLNPPTTRFSGMGILPALVAIIPYATAAVLIAAIGYLLSQVSGALSAYNGHAVETKGYISQISDALHSTGEVIHEFGETSVKLVVAAGIGVGVYFLWKYLKARKFSSGSSSEIKTLDLVPASVEMV